MSVRIARSLPPLESIGFAGGFVCRIGRQITYLSSEAEAFYRHCADGHTPDAFLSGVADADAREALSACPALWQDWLAAPEAQEVADILRLKTAAPPVLATLTVEAPVDAGPLLFPDFDPGAEGLDAAVVDPVAALARLAETGAVFPDQLADLGGVLAWLERTERIALRYSNGAAAEAIVAELFGPAA